MGEKRVVLDEFVNSDGQPEQRERVISNLEWCLEFVSRKTQAVIFSSLKTAQTSIITFGSPRAEHIAAVDGTPRGKLIAARRRLHLLFAHRLIRCRYR